MVRIIYFLWCLCFSLVSIKLSATCCGVDIRESPLFVQVILRVSSASIAIVETYYSNKKEKREFPTWNVFYNCGVFYKDEVTTSIVKRTSRLWPRDEFVENHLWGLRLGCGRCAPCLYAFWVNYEVYIRLRFFHAFLAFVYLFIFYLFKVLLCAT